jgi:hypothetical protein
MVGVAGEFYTSMSFHSPALNGVSMRPRQKKKDLLKPGLTGRCTRRTAVQRSQRQM